LAFDTTLEASKRAGIPISKIGNLSHMDTFERVDLASLSLDEIVMKRKGLWRKLAQRELKPVRIAVLGGSTTNEVVDLLELWLLDSGFLPSFYQSEYGRYYTDAVHDSEALVAFRPDIVYENGRRSDTRPEPRVRTRTGKDMSQKHATEMRSLISGFTASDPL